MGNAKKLFFEIKYSFDVQKRVLRQLFSIKTKNYYNVNLLGQAHLT
jgi:hypothetical protein